MRMNTADTSLVPLAPGAVPRKWQTEAMMAIREHLPKEQAVLISAATGTGKGTLIASLTVKAARAGKRCLFLVHRDELIDDVMQRAREIEPALHAGKVKGAVNEIDRQCVFASVQTLRGKRLDTLPAFDFVFTDEAHHAPAKSYQAIYKRAAALNERWKHILFTATPYRNAGGGRTEGLGDVVSFLAYEYSLKQAIEDGALCPIRGVTIETDLDLSGVDPADEDELAKMIDTEPRNRAAAAKYLEHGRGKQALAFTVTIDHARHLAAELQAVGVTAEAVWGTDKERTRKIEAFKAGAIAVLCNNNLLSEGFDHPPTELVMLLRPTHSRGLYAQQVGRVTRNSPRTGKVEGVILDFVANSSTHDLASLVDLTKPTEPGPRIEVGAEVRHRQHAALSRGLVTEVRDYADRDNQGDARVLWRGAPESMDLEETTDKQLETRALALASDPDLFESSRWWRCRDLVMVKPPRKPNEPEQVSMGVGVRGMREFSISLFGEAERGTTRAGWFETTINNRRIMVAKGERFGESAMLREAGDVWEAWIRRELEVECIAVGPFDECEAATRQHFKPGKLDKRRMADTPTEKMIAALVKWKIKPPDGLSFGEASFLLEAKGFQAQINRARS